MANGKARVWAASSLLALTLIAAAGSVTWLEGRQARVGSTIPGPVTLSSGWLMQDVARVDASADAISSVAFAPAVYEPKPYAPPATASANPADHPGQNGAARPRRSSAWQQAPPPQSAAWYRAIVPGTVLTTLVANHIYPDPLYGENNRPNLIPESLCRTSYWYRTIVTVPRAYAGRRVWLNFDGINYMADVWVNGARVGEIRGAFARGRFDITSHVTPGQPAAVAVLIKPPNIPADPLEQTQQWGMGPNGGPHSKDGPTFVASQGWDWIPAIRDREMGVWQSVSLSASGPVLVRDPSVTTALASPDLADVTIAVVVRNVSDEPRTGAIVGALGTLGFRSRSVTLAGGASEVVTLTPALIPALHVAHPRLWWPNGFGEPNLYRLRLSFESAGGETWDEQDYEVGLRTVSYQLGARDDLALVVNGVPVFAKGGNWGMDEALKRIPPERLDAQMRLHRDAHYTIVRNWVGQSTSEAFYAAADRYGLMVWDEFFQPAAGLDSGRERGDTGETDIPDMALYLENARDKILRFRHHPSIVIWCGRNEGAPSPKFMAGALQGLLNELDPARYYHPDSDAGKGVRSGGPYAWQPPPAYYGEGRGGRGALVPFKTEIGSVSIPTMEALAAMMPAADLETFPNDDWATHDFATGGGNNLSANYLTAMAARYGDVSTIARFVRAAQLMNYEAFRALYEGREARLFAPANAVITWMSNPAQPSLTWQIYSHDLEPFGSFFGTKKGCEPLHIQLNQNDFHVTVVNHRPSPVEHAKSRYRALDLTGHTLAEGTRDVSSAPGSRATDLGLIPGLADQAALQFVSLELLDEAGLVVSDNFYWHDNRGDTDFSSLNQLPLVSVDVTAVRRDTGARATIEATIANPTDTVALMTHLQLRNERTGARILPVSYSDNYISLLPRATKKITIECDAAQLGRDRARIVVDGWNVTVAAKAGAVSVAPNPATLVASAGGGR